MDNLLQAEWREVAGFPDYEMTSLGYFRKKHSRLAISTGYTGTTETVQLTKAGKRYHRSVGALVRETFPGAVW